MSAKRKQPMKSKPHKNEIFRPYLGHFIGDISVLVAWVAAMLAYLHAYSDYDTSELIITAVLSVIVLGLTAADMVLQARSPAFGTNIEVDACGINVVFPDKSHIFLPWSEAVLISICRDGEASGRYIFPEKILCLSNGLQNGEAISHGESVNHSHSLNTDDGGKWVIILCQGSKCKCRQRAKKLQTLKNSAVAAEE